MVILTLRPVKLVDEHASWPGHHVNLKNIYINFSIYFHGYQQCHFLRQKSLCHRTVNRLNYILNIIFIEH